MTIACLTVLRLQKERLELTVVKSSEAFMEARLRHQRDEIEMFAVSRERARQLRHDLRHHAQILRRFIDDGETERAKNYMESIIAAAGEGETRNFCANYTVNAILSIFAERAAARGVKFTAEASVPVSLRINDIELAAIYANALDNSLEGVMRLPEGADRYIRVQTSYSGEDARLALKIANNCMPGSVRFDWEGAPLTQKENGGVGVLSIRHIVEKHNGTWFFAEKDGVFTTSVAISDV